MNRLFAAGVWLADRVQNNADLGYFIDARICEAYYERAEDKQQAIRDLIIVSDPAAILEKSGYAKRFNE